MQASVTPADSLISSCVAVSISRFCHLTRVLMPKDDDDKKSALHAYAAETLDNEVERFWKRSLFFWGFIAAAFVAYGVLIEKSDKDLPLAISCFGLICSIALDACEPRQQI